MKRRALYPGTFDPVHYGHLDLMKRACELFDEVIVGVYEHKFPSKSILFPVEERIAMIKNALNGQDNITVLSYSSLTVDFAREVGAKIIIRGLRAVSDFENEFQMAGMNRHLNQDAETVFLTPAEHLSFISSSLVREVAGLGGDVSKFVHDSVRLALQERLAK